MDILEIVLLVLGAVLCAVSFILPRRREELDEESKRQAGEQIRSILDKEIAGVQTKIDEVISETVEVTSNETERALEKMTNEKIMAINEYSDTVIDDINKNHKEVLFLYDMLNDKHVAIKNTVTEVEKTVGEMTQTARDIEISATETAKEVNDSKETAKRVADMTNRAEKTAEQTAQNMEMNVRRIVEDMIRDRVEETFQKTATPMIQEKVDEILSDASLYMEQQPKIIIDGNKAEASSYVEKKETLLESQTHRVAEPESRQPKQATVTDEKQSGDAAEPVQKPEFVQGITEKAPKVILENTNEDNMQYYVVEPDELEDGFHTGAVMAEEEPADEEDETTVKVTSVLGAMLAEEDIPEPMPFVQPVVEEKNEARNSNEKILSLHKIGMSNVAIAKELGIGVGEVKLVIDLFEGM